MKRCFFFIGCLLSTALLQAHPSYTQNTSWQGRPSCQCGCGCVAPCDCGCTSGKPCDCPATRSQ